MDYSPAFLIAPNALRDSLTAQEAGNSIKKGLKRVFPDSEVKVLPIADGGDGSYDVLAARGGGRTIEVKTKDSLHRDIKTEIAVFDEGYALIEMARASGLHYLNEEEKDALRADSYGTGIMIKKAIEEGSSTILLGVGGTACVDGGTGILKALGFRFLDSKGNEISPGGAALKNLEKIDVPENLDKLRQTKISILSDVNNPLLGENGAAAVFGPQKGASEKDVEVLENALSHFAGIVKKQTGEEVGRAPYGGAAGGVPAGLKAFLNIETVLGSDKILDILGYETLLEDFDIIITAEGKLDSQSTGGKAPVAAAKRARAKGKPVIFIGGAVPSLIDDCDYELFNSVFAIAPGPAELKASIDNAGEWLERTAFNIARTLKVYGLVLIKE